MGTIDQRGASRVQEKVKKTVLLFFLFPFFKDTVECFHGVYFMLGKCLEEREGFGEKCVFAYYFLSTEYPPVEVPQRQCHSTVQYLLREINPRGGGY